MLGKESFCLKVAEMQGNVFDPVHAIKKSRHARFDLPLSGHDKCVALSIRPDPAVLTCAGLPDVNMNRFIDNCTVATEFIQALAGRLRACNPRLFPPKLGRASHGP